MQSSHTLDWGQSIPGHGEQDRLALHSLEVGARRSSPVPGSAELKDSESCSLWLFFEIKKVGNSI